MTLIVRFGRLSLPVSQIQNSGFDQIVKQNRILNVFGDGEQLSCADIHCRIGDVVSIHSVRRTVHQLVGKKLLRKVMKHRDGTNVVHYEVVR